MKKLIFILVAIIAAIAPKAQDLYSENQGIWTTLKISLSDPIDSDGNAVYSLPNPPEPIGTPGSSGGYVNCMGPGMAYITNGSGYYELHVFLTEIAIYLKNRPGEVYLDVPIQRTVGGQIAYCQIRLDVSK